MNTVPPMVGSKDLSYLEDMLNWNLTLSKKANHYSELAGDQRIKDILIAVASTCKTHYTSLLNVFSIGGANE